MGRALTVPGLEGHTINKECLSAELQPSSEKSPSDATNLVLVFPRVSAAGSAGGAQFPPVIPLRTHLKTWEEVWCRSSAWCYVQLKGQVRLSGRI